MKIEIRTIDSESEVADCFWLMRQLRPNLDSADELRQRWGRQTRSGYQLSALLVDGVLSVLAGYRVQENLVHGRHLYVDDLITNESVRSCGYGERMMQHLISEGQRLQCAKLLLDTPLANTLGHRFYYRQGLLATAFRFTLAITEETRPSA